MGDRWGVPYSFFELCSAHPNAAVAVLVILSHISPNRFWHAVLSTETHKNSGWGDVSFAFLLCRSGDFKKLKEKRKKEKEARKKRDQACRLETLKAKMRLNVCRRFSVSKDSTNLPPNM